MSQATSLNRRRFIQTTATAALATPWLAQAAAAGPFQATGTRVGEVTDTTAIVWTRLTQAPERNNQGVKFDKPKKRKGVKEKQQPVPAVHEIEGACPADSGKARVRYGLKEDLSDAVETPWVEVSAEKDGIQQFKLSGLRPGSTYHYLSETTGGGFKGRFHTAPSLRRRQSCASA